MSHTLPAPAHVMVVEDEPRLATLLTDYLRASGQTTELLHRGDDVLPSVQQRAPDLMPLDLRLRLAATA
jgi:two-component system response regulator BaeR